MKINPLMLVAVIAFWGWQTGMWIVAVPAALLLVAPWRIATRWELTRAQLHRVADFCTVLTLLLGGYLFVTFGSPRFIILLFQWLPVALLPVALAQAWGTQERMNLDVLFWNLRRNPPRKPALVDPWFPYFAIWIVAASAANVRDQWFYIGLVALVSWPLVRIRPWSYRVGAWGVAFSFAAVLGFGIQYGLHEAQTWLEDFVPEWLSGGGSRTNPYRSTTDIGHIGSLKDSDGIVLRVVTEGDAKPPKLLHRASYNNYSGASWIARGANFGAVRASGAQRWLLAPDARPAVRALIHDFSAQRKPVLSLPAGTVAIENLVAQSMQLNTLGAVQIEREPGFFSYRVAHGGEQAFDGAPTAEDLRLPARERGEFEALAGELGFKGQSASQTVDGVKQFFANGYRYSTFQKNATVSGSPLIDFLLRTKSGHCEYFATATVLLLRAAGVPARYATGFAVLEFSKMENAWIVRQRHAHSWVRAHVNGAWIEIDTTPPTWSVEEAAGSGAWSRVSDTWAWLRFRIARAWNESSGETLLGGALILVFPFALWLAWRLYRSRSAPKKDELKQILTSCPTVGSDSEFYHVEQRLAELGWSRRTHESAAEWLARLKKDAPIDCEPLAQLVELHNRYRFDPLGLSEPQRAQLKDFALAWIERLRAQAAPVS
jgi:hypothetical protein